MNMKLICATVMACAAFQLTAMPTEEETRLAEPIVKKMLASERAELRSGKKTCSEVAAAAIKLAEEADSDAAKLLLMKGAFVLYVRAGEFDKAIETLENMLNDISDMRPDCVVNIMEESLRYVPRRKAEPIYRLLDNIKARACNTNDSVDWANDVEYKFNYRLEDGNAVITGIEPKPVGTLVVPDEIDGYRVTKIEGYNNRSPFWECDKMTKVVLPAGLEIDSFDPGAFISCKSLSSIEISDSNYQFASLDGALYSKDFSTLCVYPKTRDSIELAPGTKKIKRCAFRGCALKTAKVPEGVEVMEHWNLCECPNLESIELPKSLKHLGVCAVHGSDNVKKMVFNGDAPQAGLAHFSWGQQCVFTGAPENLVVEVRRGSKGWLGPDTIELPERWPTDQKESRPIRYMGGEVMRPMFSGMFPGWQVCPEAGREIGIVSNHRGQDNVAFVHPPSQETPAVVSRTLTLSNGNPCLFLKMASFDKGSDFHLSVLVNGEEIVPKRLICTPDNAPWQDITIPLFAWRGEEVKIEIVLTANNWWCEFPFFKRLEVAEGTGREKLDIAAIGSETGRHAFERLFPGWQASVEPARESSHRGQNDVVFVHPPSQEMPAIVSRTMTLSNGNPCLFLKMASFSKDYDFLLSVLVNGKVVLPKRLVRTPDSAPWEDIVVPLSAWRGERVRIEVVLAANNWYCEHPFFKRLEVAEGTGQEKFDPEAKDVEYKFSYKLEDGFAILTGVEPKPVGTLVVPDEIDGYLVARIGGYNEESPFWGCDQMTRVVLPKGLEFKLFDPGAFMSCKSLSSIEISDSNDQFASLDGALYSKDFSTLCVYPKTRESIELPPETKTIRFCAFRGCALKTAKIPEGVEGIGRWNLCECPNLESVELPESLNHWGVCAVYGSDKVTKMVFNGDAPRVDGGWQELFTGAPAALVVEVRKGTTGWMSPDSTELPERWPTDQKESRPIRYIGEKLRELKTANGNVGGRATATE